MKLSLLLLAFPLLISLVVYRYFTPPSLPELPPSVTSHSLSYRLGNLTSVTTVDNDIYERFAEQWWNKKDGALTGLHHITPVRVEYFMQQIEKWMLRNKQNTPTGGTKKRKLHRNMKELVVADVGCGAGILTEQLTTKLLKRYGKAKIQVTGVDPSPGAIQQAKEHSHNMGLSEVVSFEVAGGEKLPMRSNSVDILLMSDVLEHIGDIRSVMKEVTRVLRPGGMFLFDTMDRSLTSYVLFIRLAQQNIVPSLAVCPPNTHDYQLFIKPEEMDQLFDENGLQRQEEYTGILLKPYNIKTIIRNLYRYFIKGDEMPSGGVMALVGRFVLIDANKYRASYAGSAIKV